MSTPKQGRCGNKDRIGGRDVVCELPAGHDGPHSQAGASWLRRSEAALPDPPDWAARVRKALTYTPKSTLRDDAFTALAEGVSALARAEERESVLRERIEKLEELRDGARKTILSYGSLLAEAAMSPGGAAEEASRNALPLLLDVAYEAQRMLNAMARCNDCEGEDHAGALQNALARLTEGERAQ